MRTMQRFISDKYRQEILSDYPGFVRRIRGKLDETGLAVLDDFIDPSFLGELRTNVDQLTPVCYANGKRKHLVGHDLDNTGFMEITYSDFLVKLANDILAPFNVQIEATDIHPVINILIGEQ